MNDRLIKILLGLGILFSLSAAQSRPDCRKRVAELEGRLDAVRHRLVDWADLVRYGSENTELPAPYPSEERVVFIGDEITQDWGRGNRGKFFPGNSYLNRGIAFQTTPQMLVRFRQDVISLKPKAVVIQGGANDLAGFTGPATQAMIAENIMSMVELAKANGIKVVLASLLPVCDCFKKQTATRSQGKIIGLNGWLKEYAAQSGSVYLDYYSAMVDGRDLKREYTIDGFLPNDAGYAVMVPLAENAIAQALSEK
jgi:lysophospholipase L1-like esterase